MTSLIIGGTWVAGMGLYVVCHIKMANRKKKNNLRRRLRKISDLNSGKSSFELFKK